MGTTVTRMPQWTAGWSNASPTTTGSRETTIGKSRQWATQRLDSNMPAESSALDGNFCVELIMMTDLVARVAVSQPEESWY